MPAAVAPGRPVQQVVIPYAPRPQQWTLHDLLRDHRFVVAVCHRRMGKTTAAINHLLRAALTTPRPAPRFAYIGPTYRQAKTIAWDMLRHYAPATCRPHIQELRLDTPNGGQVRLFGADNPDSLRGIYLDGVVLDEYGLMPPNVFSEVIRPTLVDREGWALFLGTPAGKNQFYRLIHGDETFIGAIADAAWGYAEFKASGTGLIPEGELAAARAVMTADEYAQEFECSFDASVKGAIYGRELEAARTEGRITTVPVEPALPVDTDWDLGIGDATVIWFSQQTRAGQVRLVDYLEASGEGLPYYVRALHQKSYVYGTHWAPHDVTVRELGTGKSRLEIAQGLGLRWTPTPRVAAATAYEVEEGIHASRLLLSRCWFDAERCRMGLEALGSYRREYNSRIEEFTTRPRHDHASHAADAFRGLAVRTQERAPAAPIRTSPARLTGGSWMGL